MTNEQKQVRLFMEKANQACPTKPTVPDLKTRILMAKMMLEETLKSINKGLGLAVMQETGLPEGSFEVVVKDFNFVEVGDVDLAELADGLGDSSYVGYYGTANACGIDMKPVFQAISEANMKKFGPGSWIREDMKQIKPPGWKHPDIKSIIDKQLS